MAQDLERLVVQLSADIKGYERAMNRAAGVTNSSMRSVERRAKAAARSVEASMGDAASKIGNSMRNMVGALGIGLGLREVIQSTSAAAAEYVKLTNTLKVAGLEGATLKSVMGELYRIAQANGTAIGPLATLYSRAAGAQKELNASSAQLLQFTNGVSLALRVAGTDSVAASGALLQLCQALGSGKIQADELNGILDGARPIIQAAAAGLVEAGGSVGKFIALAKEGKISSEAFFNAFLRGIPVLDEMATKAQGTVGQALERVQNAFVMLVGEMDKTSGASKNVADNLDGVAAVLEKLPQYLHAAAAGFAQLNSFMNQVGNNPVWDKIYNGFKAMGLAGMNGVEDTNKFDQAWGASDTASRGSLAGPGNPLTMTVKPKPPKISPVSLKDFAAPAGKSGGGGKSDAEREAESYERLVRAGQARIKDLHAEHAALGLTEQAAEALRFEQELINRATVAGIELTPEQLNNIKTMAQEYGALAASLESAKEAQQALQSLMTDAVKGIVSDLREGKSAAEAFTNALDRIADKLIDMAVNKLVESALGGMSGGAGGIGGAIASLFAPARASGGPVSAGQPYTVGERGRETFVPTTPGRILPMGRGGSGGVKVNIVNNAGADVSSRSSRNGNGEVQLDIMVDRMVGQKVSTPGTASNRAVRTFGGGIPLIRR